MPIIAKQNWGIRIRGIESWQNFLKEMETEIGVNSELASRIGDTAIKMINQQVDRHEDMDGKKFHSYSPAYAKKKGVSVDAVDLKKTRAMIQSLRHHRTFERNRTVIIIAPTGQKNQVKAWVHHIGAISGRRRGRFRMPERHWFGLQKSNQAIIMEMQREKLREFLARKGGQRRLF